MYEIRQQQRKQMREHRFFYHFILAIGIFVFSQGCSLMQKSAGYASTLAIFGIIMHNASVGKLFTRYFKLSPHSYSKIVMVVMLFVLAIISYFINLGITYFVLLDIVSIILFVILSLILSKSKTDRSK